MAAQPKISQFVPVAALLLLALFASPVGAESGTAKSSADAEAATRSQQQPQSH